MVSQVLAPATAAGVSSDVTVAAGSTNTVAMYTSLNDDFLLPIGSESHFLLPDGVSVLLLPSQAGGGFRSDEVCLIELKDPVGTYGPSGMILKSSEPFKTLGPGIWRVSKPVTTSAVGIQSE